MSTAEFEKDETTFMDLVNDPGRQADINARNDEREQILERFHAKQNGQRRERILFQAGKYLTAAVGFMAVTSIAMDKEIIWLAWTAGVVSMIMALIASYGFGKANGGFRK